MSGVNYMMGSDFDGFTDPAGWTITEKFDGFFVRWTGRKLLLRDGADTNAPAWFLAGLPRFALDCELYAGPGKRNLLNACNRWKAKSRWETASLRIFDAPLPGTYEQRMNKVEEVVGILPSRHAGVYPSIQTVRRFLCRNTDHLIRAMCKVVCPGGEGLVIRHPSSPYTVGRVKTMMKVKPEIVARLSCI